MSVDDRYLGGAHHTKILPGDFYPSNFSFSHVAINQDLFTLWRKNEFIQLLIDWMPYEAFRQGVQFIEEEGPITGIKHGQPYTFKGYEYQDKNSNKSYSMTGFEEYCQWNGVMEQFMLAVSMSRLYPEGALLVFLDDTKTLFPIVGKEGNEIQWKANPNPQGYFSFKAFQPINVNDSGGFSIEDDDENGIVTKWKVVVGNANMNKQKTLIIDAGRCIHIQWKKKSNSWLATSRVDGIARIAQLETQIFEKLTKRAHDLAGGILTLTGIAGEAEQTKLDNALGEDLTSVDRVYLQGDRTVEYVTPDLKAAGEFSAIFEMFTRKLCRHARVSQLILDGEHTGAGLGGNNNIEMLNSYSEIYQIQEHYRTALEHVFFKLGKNNTSFVYNEILPDDMTQDEENVDGEGDGDSENESDKEEKPKEKPTDT
jgi:hypothetical protein